MAIVVVVGSCLDCPVKLVSVLCGLVLLSCERSWCSPDQTRESRPRRGRVLPGGASRRGNCIEDYITETNQKCHAHASPSQTDSYRSKPKPEVVSAAVVDLESVK